MPSAPESATLTPRHFAEIMVQDNAEWLVNAARDVIKQAIPTLVDALTAPQETVEKISETVSSLARFCKYADVTTVASDAPTKHQLPLLNVRHALP